MTHEYSAGARRSGIMNLRDFAGGALIFGAILLAYLPALRGGLLWDDDVHITKPELRSLHGLGRIWSDVGATQQYYPVLHSAFWLEHRLWGDAVVGYHLVNLLLHAVAACLVVAIVRRLFAEEPGALAAPAASSPAGENAGPTPRRFAGVEWLAGFIFALHPVCVESVAWIAEQKNTLSAVFYLGAALSYLQFDRDRRRSQYYLALGLFVLALLSKSVTATLPAALLVVCWWRQGRLGWRQDVAPLLPWFVLGVSGGLFSAWVERTYIGANGADFNLTLIQRGLLACRVIWFYLGKLVWPVDLMFVYPRWTVKAAAGWSYLFPLGVLALALGLWLLARRHRGPLAGLLFFVGTLFPVLGFLNVYPFVFSFVADHFQYLASLGVIVPLATGLAWAANRLPPGARRLALVLGGALLAVLGALTWRQSANYRDAGTLYRATLALNPACWMAHNNLGNVLARTPGREAEAVGEFEAALAIKPDLAEAHFNRANVLARIPGRLPEALAEYEAALRLKPDYPEAHNNLGRALAGVPGRLPEAMAQFAAALRLNPAFAEAHNNLGVALAMIPGRLGEALVEYESALRINPNFAKAHFNRANALARIPARLPEAVAEYETALRLDPRFAEAYCNLGTVLLGIPGRSAEALARFEAALRIRPDLEPARQMVERLRGARP